jgi:hypothetical protein
LTFENRIIAINHEIDWTNAEFLETEINIVSTKNPRKTNKNRCMNLNDGFGVTAVYGKEKEEWLRRGRGVYIKKTANCVKIFNKQF